MLKRQKDRRHQRSRSVEARPRPVWNYNRLSNADSNEQPPAFDITNPIPELYFDRLAETEAEAVKRNHAWLMPSIRRNLIPKRRLGDSLTE